MEIQASQLLAFSRRQPLPAEGARRRPAAPASGGLFEAHSRRGQSIRLETVGAAGLWAIEADQNQLETSLFNLAINARDAMPEGGKLTIEASNVFLDESYADQHTEVKAGQYVLISDTDCGSGMTEEVRSCLRPIFHHQNRRRDGSGHEPSPRVRETVGGHIKLYSEPGEGTTVHLYFREATRRNRTTEDPPLLEEQTERGTETILVVEDDEQVRNFVCETLAELNYQVVRASDAAAALRIIDQSPNIDLLLTDVVMPAMNGRLLSDEITKRRPAIRVLFMTGYSRQCHRASGEA